MTTKMKGGTVGGGGGGGAGGRGGKDERLEF